jgi:putative ABC transport system substrate-binding protein
MAGTATVLLIPLTARAQQPGKIWRIGFLGSASASSAAARVEALRQGLRELGYSEERNLLIEFRWADGNNDRLQALAAELIQLKVGVIVTQGTPPTVAAKQATPTIPIVFAVAGDPIGSGLVASLARPGGNVTGLTDIAPEMAGKRLELLREAAPGVTRIAVLLNPGNPSARPQAKDTEAAARTLGMSILSIEVKDMEQLDSAFAAAFRERAGAVVVLSDPSLFSRRSQIAELAKKNRLPPMAWTPEFVESGCLMAYGANVVEMHRRAATYVDKILKGAKPAGLPVEQPNQFELVINIRTAKALGLTLPTSLLRRADQVIQ